MQLFTKAAQLLCASLTTMTLQSLALQGIHWRASRFLHQKEVSTGGRWYGKASMKQKLLDALTGFSFREWG